MNAIGIKRWDIKIHQIWQTCIYIYRQSETQCFSFDELLQTWGYDVGFRYPLDCYDGVVCWNVRGVYLLPFWVPLNPTYGAISFFFTLTAMVCLHSRRKGGRLKYTLLFSLRSNAAPLEQRDFLMPKGVVCFCRSELGSRVFSGISQGSRVKFAPTRRFHFDKMFTHPVGWGVADAQWGSKSCQLPQFNPLISDDWEANKHQHPSYHKVIWYYFIVCIKWPHDLYW